MPPRTTVAAIPATTLLGRDSRFPPVPLLSSGESLLVAAINAPIVAASPPPLNIGDCTPSRNHMAMTWPNESMSAKAALANATRSVTASHCDILARVNTSPCATDCRFASQMHQAPGRQREARRHREKYGKPRGQSFRGPGPLACDYRRRDQEHENGGRRSHPVRDLSVLVTLDEPIAPSERKRHQAKECQRNPDRVAPRVNPPVRSVGKSITCSWIVGIRQGDRSQDCHDRGGHDDVNRAEVAQIDCARGELVAGPVGRHVPPVFAKPPNRSRR